MSIDKDNIDPKRAARFCDTVEDSSFVFVDDEDDPTHKGKASDKKSKKKA